MNNQQIDLDGDTGTTDVVWFYLTTDLDGVPTVPNAAATTTTSSARTAGSMKRHDIPRIMGRSPMDPAPPTA